MDSKPAEDGLLGPFQDNFIRGSIFFFWQPPANLPTQPLVGLSNPKTPLIWLCTPSRHWIWLSRPRACHRKFNCGWLSHISQWPSGVTSGKRNGMFVGHAIMACVLACLPFARIMGSRSVANMWLGYITSIYTCFYLKSLLQKITDFNPSFIFHLSSQ